MQPTPSLRENLRVPKQQIVDYFCPTKSIRTIDAALTRIKRQAQLGCPIRTFVPEEQVFKCEACEHDEAWVYPTHSSCKKCGVVKDKTHRGKEWRDIRERGDMNTCGMLHQTSMSQGYNYSTFISERDKDGKRVPARFTKIIKRHKEKFVKKDTKDQHILDAKRAFADVSDRVHYGANAKESTALFVRFLNSVEKLRNKNEVMAACMFHTLKKPRKPWKKVFRNKTKFNDSKKKRLKMMTFKKRPMVIKKYL